MTSSLRALDTATLAASLARGLRVRVGPFTLAIRSDDPALARDLAACYPDYPLAPADAFAHCTVSANRPHTRWPRRRPGLVRLDDGAAFTHYDGADALPYVEWAINWCIATRCHFFLMLHAAVVARPGSGALIMPGPPGAGKSTLCAYLAHHGWRHMADEFCLIRPGTRAVAPFPRLIPLKNESIDVIAAVDGVRMGPRYTGTRKGTVAHVAPPDAHARCADTVTAGLVVLPVFMPDRAADIHSLGRPELFVELSKNSFNYPVLGRSGFDTLADLVERVPAYRMRYDRLDTAANLLAELASRHLEPPETSAP